MIPQTLRNQALRALQTAKHDLSRDKYLLPVAIIVTKDRVRDFNLKFEDSEQKASVYLKLVAVAKEEGATAIITVNDATLRGPEQVSAGQDCIFVTVSGPGLDTWSISVPYRKAAEGIAFGPPTETTNDLLNLLPEWARQRSPEA